MTSGAVQPTPSRTVFTLHTLGEAGLFAAGSPDSLLPPGKPFALLVYLALAPGRRSSREFLLDLLWSDVDEERSRRSLRQSLFQLRRVLGDDVLTGVEEVTLSTAVQADRDHFLKALDLGDIDAGIALYSGHFLPAFGIPGGSAFEQWADGERHRLKSAYLRSADLAVRRHLGSSHFKDAQRLATRARELVPESEIAWRLVLEAATSARDVLGAAVEADAVERWAQSEGIKLEAATRAIVARARGLTPATSDGTTGSVLAAELIGREKEFSAITAGWARARQGRSLHLHVASPAGFGKSRLLRDACHRLEVSGARVVLAQGTAGDRDVQYAFAGDLAAAIAALPGAKGVAPASAATLVALNPALSGQLNAHPDPSHGAEMLRRRIHAIADLVHAVAGEQPFVLAIDDLHWIDDASWTVLEGVLGRCADLPLLIVTASRPERVPARDDCTQLPLTALTQQEVDSFARALGELPASASWSGDFVERLHGAAGGSPLLILETLRLALDMSVLALSGNEWQCRDEAGLAQLLRSGQALRERVRTLTGSESHLLSLLSVAGGRVDLAMLAPVVGMNLPDMGEAVRRLEQMGMAVRSGMSWKVAHDEMASASETMLLQAQLAEVNQTLGRYYVSAADANPEQMLRAGRHLAAAGDQAAVHRHFRRSVMYARTQGDRRPYRQLGAEFLGEPLSSAPVSALIAGLPLRWRAGLWSWQRQAAALAIILAVPVAGVTATALRNREGAGLQRLVYADSVGATMSMAARPAEWDGAGDPATLSPFTSTLTSAALAFPELPPAISPDGRSVAWTEDHGDSTTRDIWIRTPAGTRRLTFQPRDDVVYDWLPDGSGLVGLTNRWALPSPNDQFHVAIFDTATGAARPVNSGDGHTMSPFASPDGTRIAYLRRPANGLRHVCIAMVDGRSESTCQLPGGEAALYLVGWIGLNEILFVRERGGQLLQYDWLGGVVTPVVPEQVEIARLSPDRRWVVAAVLHSGSRSFRDMVVPLSRPGAARAVTRAGSPMHAVRWWEGPPDRSLLIERIEFTDSVREVQTGIATRLTVRALTASGVEVPLRAPVAWHSGDTLVATVDSAGDVSVRARGSTTITATLVGWRTVSKQFTVSTQPAIDVLDERWDANWVDRWLPWGTPLPIVIDGPGRVKAFLNRGDGSHQSFALLRKHHSAQRGLGVEVRVSTQITHGARERLVVNLVSGLDPAALARADQQKAPPSLGSSEGTCGAAFPSDGVPGKTVLTVRGNVGSDVDLGADALPLRTGAWWTLRVQLFPDGRCGIAVNRRVVWISPVPVRMTGMYRVWLGNEAVDSRILHGPLKLWTGVRTDIDWGKRPQ